MEFLQCLEEKIGSVSGLGSPNGLIHQLKLLLVQPQYHFSGIFICHHSISTRSSGPRLTNVPAISRSRSRRIHHGDGVDLDLQLWDDQGADLNGRTRRGVDRKVPSPYLLHRGQIGHISEEHSQPYHV